MSDTAAAATLRINGLDEPLGAPTVAALLASRDVSPNGRGVAVAVNGAVVPRRAWPGTLLRDGDQVEVVTAVQGG